MVAIAGKTVREVALEVPSATRIFEQLGIDYCCGGLKPLEEACASANISVDDVVRKLEDAERQAAQSANGKNWQQTSLTDLIEHIVNTHHTYVKQELPRLEQLLAKVCGVHGQNHPELLQIRETFADLDQELTGHLMKEEQILFPYITEMEQGHAGHSCFGTVQNPIRMMMFEHDNAGVALRSMRAASSNYQAPPDACISYQTLYGALQAFEADLHQHIHLENNILFPRAIAMEDGN
ncbi:MAG: iron-sulfur cluster repair di-iron protein [Terriglobales bacterium]